MKTHNRAAILGLIAVALTACPAGPDTTAPTVLSSTPTNGATNVAVSASLSIHFSEAMDKTTVAVTSSPANNLGAPVWNDAQTVVFSPPVALQLGSSYTITVDGKDLAGNALGGTKTISFQTASAPDTTPPATPSGIKATAGDASFTLEWTANTEPDLAGYTVYWGTAVNLLNNAQFVEKSRTTITVSALVNATSYYYALEAQDASGNHSAKSSPASVTPLDKTPPTLTSSEPANGTLDIALVPKLRLTFSEPMQTNSVEFGLCVTGDPPATATCAAPVLANFGTPTWSNGDTVVQFTPTDQFQAGKTQVLLVFAKDKAGNPLEAQARVAFSIRATPDTTPPTLTNFSSDVTDPTATLSFTFSEPMDQTSVQNAFLSQPAISCAWSWSGNTATCKTGVLQQNTPYTVTIGTGARDTAQNAMVASAQKTFNVGNLLPRVTKFLPNPGPFGGFFAPNTPIILSFSEPMDTVSAQSAFLVKVGTTIIAGSFSWSDSTAGTNTVMQFTPSTGYGNGATVTWKLAYFASDLTQVPMAADVTHFFQTQPINQ
jgi:methionine-rich copper-binding protein CopC